MHINRSFTVGLSDGDTITLLSPDKKQLKVRVAAIDSPESGQANGKAAKKFLSNLIYKKTVEIDPYKLDRYGRTVTTVWLGDVDVGLEMVKAGYAWVFTKYADPKVFPEYYAAEKVAKKDRMGLWSDPASIPPWEWRHPTALPMALKAGDSDKCSQKRFCKQMASCEEAKYYLDTCGYHALDKDGDGIPCSKLCR